MTAPRLCVRWTIGDVLPYGVEALRLSIWGAYRCFGRSARYAVCVHDVPLARARAVASPLPGVVDWHAVDAAALPRWLLRRDVSPRAVYRFAPVLVDPTRAELLLDRRCVMFATPPSVAAWLEGPNPRATVVLDADDGTHGLAMRGAGVGFDLEEALREALRESPHPLRTREDAEQLELAALGLLEPPREVAAREVAIHALGTHGVRLAPPQDAEGRARWDRHVVALHDRLELPRAVRPVRSHAI